MAAAPLRHSLDRDQPFRMPQRDHALAGQHRRGDDCDAYQALSARGALASGTAVRVPDHEREKGCDRRLA